jgi:PIF1 helicase.
MDVPGLQPHNLQLKVVSVVMTVQNLNQPELCNGTHLVIKKHLMINVVHATILRGKFKDEEVIIPKISMLPTDMRFQFKRI